MEPLFDARHSADTFKGAVFVNKVLPPAEADHQTDDRYEGDMVGKWQAVSAHYSRPDKERRALNGQADNVKECLPDASLFVRVATEDGEKGRNEAEAVG